MRVVLICFISLAVAGMTGCKKTRETESKDAVKAAIEAHLQQRSNLMLANMTLEVEDVKFSGDRAEAAVKFRSKQAPDLVVGVRYVLRRTGDRWQVESGSPSSGMGGAAHGGAGAPAPAPAPTTPAPQSSH